MAFVNTIDTMGDEALQDALLTNALTEYRDDTVTHLGIYSMGYKYRIQVLDFPALTNIDRYALSWAENLHTLILRGNVVCTLVATNGIEWTKIAIGTGYIYVPAALKAQYTQATNWSTYAAQFRALEDYTVDGTIWGDLDPNKI
jgi:hypothetical protein